MTGNELLKDNYKKLELIQEIEDTLSRIYETEPTGIVIKYQAPPNSSLDWRPIHIPTAFTDDLRLIIINQLKLKQQLLQSEIDDFLKNKYNCHEAK